MSLQSETVSYPTTARLARSMPAGRFVVVWALAWAGIGCFVAAGVVVLTDLDLGPALSISLLFAEVVGFTSLVSARLIFPLFVRLPYALSLGLQVMTLLSGTVFGSVAVAALYPLLSLRQPRIVALIVLANALLAVITGIALYTYDTMRRQIERSYRELRDKEALDRELRIARDVQQRLLPIAVPTLSTMELSGINIPAVGVGGDYFDFVVLGEDQVGLVIADVSGKGVPAALLMAGLQAAVRSLAQPGADPGELTRKLNRILYDSSSPAHYATLFVGFYDGEQQVLSYSNAGHHPPLVIGADGARALERGGLPLGMFPDSSYERQATTLVPGDLIVLFTDGVTEAPDGRDQEFGEQRLIAALEENRQQPLEALSRIILDRLKGWGGHAEAHDDVTLVLARVR